MNATNTSDEPGYTEALKRASGVAWQGMVYRFELLATELHEDKQRLIVLGVLTQVAALSAFMAFLCLNMLILVVFWETHRVPVAVILTAFYTVVAVAAVLVARRRAKHAPPPFEATIAELRKDRAALTRAEP